MIVSVALFFALVAWTYLASCFLEDSFYNAYVNRLRSAMFRPVTAVQRAVPRLSERAAAALVFALAVAVVAALSRVGASSAVPGGAPAGAAFGGGLRVLPARSGADAALALAAGRFAILLGQLALLRLLLVWRLGGGDGSGVLAFLDTAAWPLSLPRGLSQTAAAACAALFGGTALCVFAFSPAAVAEAFSVLRLAAVAAADAMLLLGNFLFAACVLSWIRLVPSVAAKRPWWREALDFACDFSADALSDFTRALVGPSPVALGMVSFAPLVACFVLRFLHGVAVGLIL